MLCSTSTNAPTCTALFSPLNTSATPCWSVTCSSSCWEPSPSSLHWHSSATCIATSKWTKLLAKTHLPDSMHCPWLVRTCGTLTFTWRCGFLANKTSRNFVIGFVVINIPNHYIGIHTRHPWYYSTLYMISYSWKVSNQKYILKTGAW